MKYSSLVLVAVLMVSHLGCANGSSPTDPATIGPGLVLTPTTLSLAVGDSTQLRVVVAATDSTHHLVTSSGTWKSANETVATVTSGGVVTGRASGTADITVTVSEGTATVTVTVTNVSQPVTFIGAAAGPATDTGTLKFSAISPSSVSGMVYFAKVAMSVFGRFDEPTQVVDLDAGGYRFLGVVSGNVLTGAYVDPVGLTGGFSAIDATHNAVTVYCGSYTSDGTTELGNSDSGALVLAVSSDGTAAASSVTADASRAPQAFVGRIEGEQLSLISKTGETLQGPLQGESATGVFPTATGSSATFSITSSACH